MKEHYLLNEENKRILWYAKAELTGTIKDLIHNGLRKTNIEIELISHIKKALQEEQE